MSTEKEDSIELANTIKQFLESKGYKVEQDEDRLSVDTTKEEMRLLIKELKERKNIEETK